MDVDIMPKGTSDTAKKAGVFILLIAAGVLTGNIIFDLYKKYAAPVMPF